MPQKIVYFQKALKNQTLYCHPIQISCPITTASNVIRYSADCLELFKYSLFIFLPIQFLRWKVLVISNFPFNDLATDRDLRPTSCAKSMAFR